jgi:hypothetical protein
VYRREFPRIYELSDLVREPESRIFAISTSPSRNGRRSVGTIVNSKSTCKVSMRKPGRI